MSTSGKRLTIGPMSAEPAGRAEPSANEELEQQANGNPPEDPRQVRPQAEIVREAAAKLYGQGYKRPKIAKVLLAHLITDEMKTRPIDQQMQAARMKLRRWERTQSFRDLIYKDAVVKLDLDMPGIFQGIAKKAKRGRVDAARLALEVTGRHNPKGDQAPTQIALIVNGVPRPKFQMDVNHPVVEADVDGQLVQDTSHEDDLG